MNELSLLSLLALDYVASPVFVINKDYDIVFSNERFRLLFGESGTEPENRALSRLFCEDKIPADLLLGVENLGGVWVKMKKANNQEFEAKLYCKLAEHQDITGYRVVTILDAKDAENEPSEFELLQKKFEGLQKDFNEFVYTVSHDLKAPIRGISALAGWIVEDHGASLNAMGNSQMALLMDQVSKLNKQLDGILSYSRLSSRHSQKEQIVLKDIITEYVARQSFDDNISIDIDEDMPVVIGERKHFERLMEELISNSLNHGGILRDNIRIGFDDTLMCFYVRDNGKGIEKKYHDQVFKLFFMINPGANKENMGVGLSLVKKIVEIYDGKIAVHSLKPRGVEFRFTLPLYK